MECVPILDRRARKPDGGRAGSPCWCVSHYQSRLVVSTSATPAKTQKNGEKQQGEGRNGKNQREIEICLEIKHKTGLQWPKRGMNGEEGGAGARGTAGGVKSKPKTPRVLLKSCIYTFEFFRKKVKKNILLGATFWGVFCKTF